MTDMQDVDHPDCVTDRERELYDALMGIASHASSHHAYKNWVQGGVKIEPIVSRALRLNCSPADRWITCPECNGDCVVFPHGEGCAKCDGVGRMAVSSKSLQGDQ
jgi:hypothetical protein